MRYLKKFNEADSMWSDIISTEIISVLKDNRFKNASKEVKEEPIFRHHAKSTETIYRFTSDKDINYKINHINSELTGERIIITRDGSFTDIPFDDDYRENVLAMCREKIK